MLKALYNRASGSTFLRHNLIFFIGSLFVAFLNYLYYPVLGRMLQPADFGEVQAIVAFFMQTGVFLAVLGLVAVSSIKKYSNTAQRDAIIKELEYFTTLIGLVLLCVLLILSPWIQEFLQFQSPLPFMVLAFAAFLGINGTVSNSFLQGMQRFGALAWSNIVPAASKLVFSVIFVLAGLRATGASMGLAVSALVSLIYTYSLSIKVGRPKPTMSLHIPNFSLIKPELSFAGVVFAASLCMNLALTMDILAVKHYFPPDEAGMFAGMSAVAHIVFFVTGPLAAVLVASVKTGDDSHNRRLLIKSLGLVCLVSGVTLAFFTLLPELIITLLVGAKYVTYAHLMPTLGLALFVLSLCNSLVLFSVTLRRRSVAWVSALGVAVMAIMLMLNHKTIADVVSTLLEGSVVLFILILIAVNLKLSGGNQKFQTEP